MKITFESEQKYILVHAKGKIKPQAAKELFVNFSVSVQIKKYLRSS